MTSTPDITAIFEGGPYDGTSFVLPSTLNHVSLAMPDDTGKAVQHSYRRLEFDSDPLAAAVFTYQSPEDEAAREERFGL